MITPRDEYFHDRSDDPHWNESGWFSFMVPARRLSGMVYCYHRPNMGYSVGGFAAWDPSGDRYDDCLWYDLEQISPLGPGSEMFDFTLPTGLSVACVEPLREYRLQYKEEGCEVDFTWRAVRPPFSPPLPASQGQWGRHHYDQIGRVTGQIGTGGETIDVDGWSMRDHSWGPRKVARDQRGRFVWGIASEDDAFLVWASAASSTSSSESGPGSVDPVVGAPERVVSGWLLRDGVMAAIVDGESHVFERRADGAPLADRIRATDELGRSLSAEGRAANMITWPCYPTLYAWFTHFEWEVDGLRASGEEQEWIPLQQRRAFVRRGGLRACGPS
jgi:hypothetical protein